MVLARNGTMMDRSAQMFSRMLDIISLKYLKMVATLFSRIKVLHMTHFRKKNKKNGLNMFLSIPMAVLPIRWSMIIGFQEGDPFGFILE